MKLLFLGGNRFFGKKIIFELSKNYKNKIYLINRSNKKNIKKKNIFLIRSDRNDFNLIKKKIGNIKFDFIIDNIAYNEQDVKNIFFNFKSNFKHYIFTSTVMTYLDESLTKVCNENTKKKNQSIEKLKKVYKKEEIKYALDKLKAENFLIKNKKNFTILRLHNVIGVNDFSKKSLKLLNFNNSKFINKNSHKLIQFIYDQDLIFIFKKLIKNLKKDRKYIYNVANDPISVKDFYNIRNKYGKKNLFKNEAFPLPLNNLINNHKIKKKLKMNFTNLKRIIKNFSINRRYKI